MSCHGCTRENTDTSQPRLSLLKDLPPCRGRKSISRSAGLRPGDRFLVGCWGPACWALKEGGQLNREATWALRCTALWGCHTGWAVSQRTSAPTWATASSCLSLLLAEAFGQVAKEVAAVGGRGSLAQPQAAGVAQREPKAA